MELDARVCDRARLARDGRFDGRFYIAVLSTGIYCRPSCPSPTARRENVRFFRTAVEAADSGFRACLRCRPEAAPGTPRWNGTASTVSRALRLIEQNALQDESLAAISRRLGVSARQLDRLFQMHLGASPIAIANTWRMNFARRLLRDSDLPISRVAIASGFRTVRRFNDAVRGAYGRSPSELRRNPAALAQTARDEYVIRLTYQPPYDWVSMLSFLEARAVPGVEEVEDGVYRRTFAHDDRSGILQVSHDEHARAFVVRVRFPEPVALLPIAARLRAMLDLAASPAAIERHFRRDPIVSPLVGKRPGLRIPGSWDPFETWIRAALGENLGSSAVTAAALLVECCGETLDLRETGRLTRLFPTSARLADGRLRGLTPSRARSVVAVAEAVRRRLWTHLDLDEGEARRLAAAAGMTAAAAQYTVLRASGQPDAFPDEDPLLRGAAPEGCRTASALAALSERWRPWRAYAAVHLWREALDRSSENRKSAAG